MGNEDEKKWQRRSDARPAELTKAAFELFTERGFAATRLEDVAARAQVSKATIYRYFANKEALFEAVVRDAIAPRFAEAEMLFEVYRGTNAELLRMLLQVARGALQGPLPPMVKLIVGESRNFPELARLWADLVVARFMKLIEKVIRRGIEHGEFRDVKPEHHVPLVMAPVLFLALVRETFANTSVKVDEDSVLTAHVDMLLRGLLITPPEGASL